MVKDRRYDLQIFEADLKGDRIRFSLFGEVDERMVRQDYKGRISGDTILGTVDVKGTPEDVRLRWQATRVE